MATVPTTINSAIDLFQAIKGAVMRVVKPLGFDTRSAGTRDLALSESVDPKTGFWANSVTSKPPRWIIHVDVSVSPPVTSLASGSSGLLTGAGSPGYINNGQGNCVAASFRIIPALKGLSAPASPFTVPSGWEWIVTFICAGPLQNGTSGDLLSDFDLANGALSYKGRSEAKTPVKIAHIALGRLPISPPAVMTGSAVVTYDTR